MKLLSETMDESEDDTDDEVKYLAFVPGKNPTRIDKSGKVCKQILLTDLDVCNDSYKNLGEESATDSSNDDHDSETSDLECQIVSYSSSEFFLNLL